jgi:hypothetical protein
VLDDARARLSWQATAERSIALYRDLLAQREPQRVIAA